MSRLHTIGEASKILGVSISTLRRWEAEGSLMPERTLNGHRRYDLEKLRPGLFRNLPDERRTIAYAIPTANEF